jgi:hypothetical protein
MTFGPVVTTPITLGGTEMAAAGPSSAVVGPFRACKYLTIAYCVTGYASGGGILGLRFGISGGAIDTGARYRHKNMPGPTTAVATFTAAVISSTTTAPAFMLLADAAITTRRTGIAWGMNRNSTAHTFQWITTNESTSAIVHQKRILGDGGYHSSTAGQITSVQMVVSGGDLSAGTGFEVWGSTTI